MKDADDLIGIGPGEVGSLESALGLEKPPTQGVGVQGFVAFEAKPSAQIPWDHIAGLPVFQMFMDEKHPRAAAGALPASQDLYDEYCQWHADKGYWPNETPLGELK